VKLYHALTGVKFAIANPKKNGKLEYDIQIKEISFTGLVNGGTCTFTPGSTGLDGGTIEWTSTSTEGGNVISQTFEPGDLVDYDKATDQNHFADSYFDGGINKNINDAKASKTFWLVPQSITGSDAVLKIKYDMNGKKDQYLEIRLGDLKASNWEAAQIRTYTFKLDEVNLKITDEISMKPATQQTVDYGWGTDDVDSYIGSTKTNIEITNTGNTTAYMRAALIGQWRTTADPDFGIEEGNPVFGYTDFTHGVQLVDSWYIDQFVAKTYNQGRFDGLPGTNWVLNEEDGFYYYTEPVEAGAVIADDLFEKYTVGECPAAAVAGKAMQIYFTLEVAVQAVSAMKLDGTLYTYTEAWDRANTSM